MKTIKVLILIAVLSVMVAPAFAETYSKSGGASYRTVKGEIVALDAAKGTFLIKDEDNGKNVAVAAFKDALNSLNVGDQVSVTMSQGSSVASQILNLGQAIQLAKKECVCPHSK